MKTILFTVLLFSTVLSYGQESHKEDPEFYFNIDLGNHKDEQLFHVDSNGKTYKFAIVGTIIEGSKQFLVQKYNLKKLNFSIVNLPITKQDLQLDSVRYDGLSAEFVNFSVFVSEPSSTDNSIKGKPIKLEEPIILDVGKLGLRKTIINITVYYCIGDECVPMEEINKEKINKGFGDHICKSRITF